MSVAMNYRYGNRPNSIDRGIRSVAAYGIGYAAGGHALGTGLSDVSNSYYDSTHPSGRAYHFAQNNVGRSAVRSRVRISSSRRPRVSVRRPLRRRVQMRRRRRR